MPINVVAILAKPFAPYPFILLKKKQKTTDNNPAFILSDLFFYSTFPLKNSHKLL